jgi:hypothetical protein
MRARRWTAEDMRSVLAHDKFHQEIKEDEMRYALRTDDNQHELVEALKKIGAKCYFIGKPVDLLCGYRGSNWLIEVKRPDKRGQQSKITQEQKDFIATWPGQVCICHTIDEAINAVVNGSK